MKSDGTLAITYPHTEVHAKVNEPLTLQARLEFYPHDAVTARINEVRAEVNLLTKNDKTDASEYLQEKKKVEGGIPGLPSLAYMLSVDYVFDDVKITKAGAYKFLVKLGLKKGETLESIGVNDARSITINVKE